MRRIGVALMLVLAVFGIADSAYLLQHELTGTPLLCNITNLTGCNVVLTSTYSHLFGIPLAQLGLFFYVAIFVVSALELAASRRRLRHFLQGLAVFGVLFSVYSTYTQVFLVRALCIYCLASALITVLLLACASVIEPWWRPHDRLEAPVAA